MDRTRDLRCASISEDVGEDMPGTAPEANGWVAIEQRGPYGRDALRESHFPSAVGTWLKETLAPLAIKPLLIRPAGAHPDINKEPTSRRVFVASSIPGASALATFNIRHPDELYDVDFSAITSGRIAAAYSGVQIEHDPLLLICSHAKRDICCAQRGRPIAKELSRRLGLQGMPHRIWESSHVGGHRFAPVGLQLPHGWVHGRFDLDRAAAIFVDAQVGRVAMSSVRGRSSLDPLAQIAEIAARQLTDVMAIDSVNATALGGNRFQITSSAGEGIELEVSENYAADPRPEACAKAPTPWHIHSIRQV